MTEPLDLEPIKARLAAATPGRWVWVDNNVIPEDAEEAYDNDGTPLEWNGRFALQADPFDEDEPALLSDEGQPVVFVIEMVEDDASDDVFELPINDADAALIANAPTDIAALVAEVERLRALVAQLSGGGNT